MLSWDFEEEPFTEVKTGLREPTRKVEAPWDQPQLKTITVPRPEGTRGGNGLVGAGAKQEGSPNRS